MAFTKARLLGREINYPISNRMMQKMSLMIGAIYGMSGVILGAMGAHRLKAQPEMLESWHTAVRYQMIHALLLVGLAILCKLMPESKFLPFASVAAMLGVLLFSGSIYVKALTGFPVGMITPTGGLLLIAAWLLLLFSAFGFNS